MTDRIPPNSPHGTDAATAPLRTPEQMEWIRDRFKPDGLQRLARAERDYADSHGYYLPDVAALAHAEWERAEAFREKLLAIRGDAERWAKRSTGEGYTYEQGRIAAVNEVLDAAS